ncbi:MAG: ribonuclease H family protein, partial [Pseudomonadota bacterium]|nr:ribonuclease H family protein [Pseudomonadota bacterium]
SKVVGFADDIAKYIEGPVLGTLIIKAQRAINRLVEWGQKLGLQFAPEKTKAVVFTRKRYERAQLTTLTIDGAPIEYVTQVKYLGITLDHKLSWRPHIDKTILKAKRTLMKVRNVTGSYWGLRPSLASWLYRGMIRPVVTYGCHIWARCTIAPGVKKKLNSLQRLALMSLGFFRHSTPTAGLEIITNTCPLWLHTQKEAFAAYIRTTHVRKFEDDTMRTTLNSTKVGHRQFIQHYLEEYGFENENSDHITEEVFQWDKKYKISLESFKEGLPQTSDEYLAFSDGSKSTAGQTGSGYVVYQHDVQKQTKSFHLGKHTTVFQAEIYAILKVAEYLDNLRLRGKNITIHSDSQAAILALQNARVTSNLVHLTMYQLNNVAEQNTVTIVWVKAHVGHKGNEKADELAKEGAADEENHVTDIPNVSVAV